MLRLTLVALWPLLVFAGGAQATVVLAPAAGYALMHSSGLNVMNSRLGDGASLSPDSQHGAAPALALSLWSPNPGFVMAWTGDLVQISDGIEARGIAGRLQSTVRLQCLSGGMSWRLYPSQPFLDLRKMGRGVIRDRFFVMGGGTLGVGRLSHAYLLQTSLAETDVSYGLETRLGLLGVSAEAGYAVIPGFLLGLGASARFAQPLSSESRVDSYWVRGQDLRYREEGLQLSTLGSARLQFLQLSASAALLL